jgi:hypothetical protein
MRPTTKATLGRAVDPRLNPPTYGAMATAAVVSVLNQYLPDLGDPVVLFISVVAGAVIGKFVQRWTAPYPDTLDQ